MYGTVKRWIEDRGFGFIEPDGGGKDVFCHYTALPTNGGRRNLEEGQRVEFDMEQGDKGPQAANVRAV